jgi:hypothetical protein
MAFKYELAAKLEDYDGPFFPENIDYLNVIMSNELSFFNNHLFLSNITKYNELDKNYTILEHVRTLDGFSWFRGVLCEYSKDIFKSKVMLLLPLSLFEIERSCAVYTQGRVSEKDIYNIVNDLVRSNRKHSNGDE